MRCPKCNRLMSLSHFMYIEECLGCGTCLDVFHDKEVDRAWVYGDGYPDDEDDELENEYELDAEIKALESAAFSGHEDVWIDVDGHQQRILGDPNMSEETKDALGNMIRAITKAIQNGDFKKKGEL